MTRFRFLCVGHDMVTFVVRGTDAFAGAVVDPKKGHVYVSGILAKRVYRTSGVACEDWFVYRKRQSGTLAAALRRAARLAEGH